jgi:hypothetical protein
LLLWIFIVRFSQLPGALTNAPCRFLTLANRIPACRI